MDEARSACHEATREAMASPLLDAPVEGATRVLLNITGGVDLTLQEVQEAADYVSRLVDPEANIIFGMVTHPMMEDEVRVTVIATGLPSEEGVFERTIEEVIEESFLDEEEPPVAPEEPAVELPGFLRRFGLRAPPLALAGAPSARPLCPFGHLPWGRRDSCFRRNDERAPSLPFGHSPTGGRRPRGAPLHRRGGMDSRLRGNDGRAALSAPSGISPTGENGRYHGEA